MSGTSNSGRKAVYEEYHKSAAINKLWEKVHNKIMKNEELTEWEEKMVAPLLSKTIKTQTDITSGDKPLPLLQYVFHNNSNTQDNGNEGENTDSIGGNVSEQVDIDSLVPDSSSTERPEPDIN